MFSAFGVTLEGTVKSICGVSAVGLIAGLCYHANLSIQRKGEPPMRWSWIPVLGYALEMGMRPMELLKESGVQFGEIFGMVVAGNRMFFINDPHCTSLILKPTKDLSFEEFHHSIMINFFGSDKKTMNAHVLNEDLMRKWYSQYLLRYQQSISPISNVVTL